MLETVLMVTDKFKTTSSIILKPKKKKPVFTLFTLIYAFLLLLGEKRKKVTKLDLILCDNLPAEDR